MEYMKAEQTNGTRWRVLAIPFGGPFKGGKDFDGEYFSPRTDIKAHWFSERPVLFHHGKDAALGDTEIGIEDELKRASDGWWAEMWLNRSNRYWAQVDALLRSGKMYGSSGAIAHLVKRAPDGEILVWPHAEQTVTPTPSNYFSRVAASKAVEHFTNAGIALDGTLKSVLADLDELSDDLRTTLARPAQAAVGPADDVATQRLAKALDELEAIVKHI